MGREGKRDGVGLGDSEFGLGMEPVNPDKESVGGDWKPERERVDFP